MTATMPSTTTTATPSGAVGPIAESRRNHAHVLHALQAAALRSARMWRRVSDSSAPVPGLQWTAAETAAHMIGDLRDYTALLTRYARGYLTHADRAPDSPARLSAAINARHLIDVPERNLHRLATELEDAVADYVAVARTVELGRAVRVPNGLIMDPSTMTGLLLAEQLIHSWDIARATDRMWSITADDALLALPAVLTVAPGYLRASRAHRRVSYELRMRGGSAYRFAVENGAASISAAGEPADCVITADPVEFLLVGFGRVSQRGPVLRGALRPGGRKPWRALRFATLLIAP